MPCGSCSRGISSRMKLVSGMKSRQLSLNWKTGNWSLELRF